MKTTAPPSSIYWPAEAPDSASGYPLEIVTNLEDCRGLESEPGPLVDLLK